MFLIEKLNSCSTNSISLRGSSKCLESARFTGKRIQRSIQSVLSFDKKKSKSWTCKMSQNGNEVGPALNWLNFSSAKHILRTDVIEMKNSEIGWCWRDVENSTCSAKTRAFHALEAQVSSNGLLVCVSMENRVTKSTFFSFDFPMPHCGEKNGSWDIDFRSLSAVGIPTEKLSCFIHHVHLEILFFQRFSRSFFIYIFYISSHWRARLSPNGEIWSDVNSSPLQLYYAWYVIASESTKLQWKLNKKRKMSHASIKINYTDPMMTSIMKHDSNGL